MNNQIIQIKIQERLNKLSSQDYGNIEPWQIVEAFNKAQSAWIRRQLEGINQTRTASEGSLRRIDDLQFILTSVPVAMTNKGIYWEGRIPADYLEWSRISAKGQDECCPARPLVIFEAEEADRDILLLDQNRQPSFDWRTTFTTLSSNTIKIYTNAEFNIVDPELTYYRKPRNIEIAGVVDPNTGNVPTVDVTCEATDGVTELLIDEAAAILAGDINDYYRQQNLTQTNERNN